MWVCGFIIDRWGSTFAAHPVSPLTKRTFSRATETRTPTSEWIWFILQEK